MLLEEWCVVLLSAHTTIKPARLHLYQSNSHFGENVNVWYDKLVWQATIRTACQYRKDKVFYMCDKDIEKENDIEGKEEWVTGPEGQIRPANEIDAGIMAARIAVGDIEEQYEETPE